MTAFQLFAFRIQELNLGHQLHVLGSTVVTLFLFHSDRHYLTLACWYFTTRSFGPPRILWLRGILFGVEVIIVWQSTSAPRSMAWVDDAR